MMRGAASILIANILILFSSVHAADDLRIAYPPDGAALAEGTIEVVGLAPDGVTAVEFSISNGRPVGGDQATVSDGAFAKVVELGSGRGRITVRAEAAPGAEVAVEVYVTRPGEAAPSDFRTFYRHEDMTTVGECTTCHRLDRGQPNYRKLKPVATCDTGDCHGDLGDKRYVHGPLGSRVCIHCHNPHGSFQPQIVSRSGGELCTVCHFDSQKFWEKSNVHSIVDAGDCIGCHSPHESDTKYQLLGASSGEVCFNCHDEGSTVGGNVTHAPVEQLECTLCHDPHSSDYPFMLPSAGNDVCFDCHEGKREEFNQAVQHAPVAEDCMQCHNVHTADHAYLLFAPQDQFCIECHREVTPDFVAAFDQVSVPHEPVQEGNCLACHVAHATPHEMLLSAPLDQICTTCHSEMGQQILESPYLHGPVEDAECSICHVTHGSTNPKILSTYFPEEFYVPYREENYEHCFECHNEDIAREASTTTLTDFRNGEQNLHYAHVNKDPKGRSCKSCHEIHAGPQLKHIRAEVPFGDMWSYPIAFTKTESGGGCIVGCHKPLLYDRDRPVSYR